MAKHEHYQVRKKPKGAPGKEYRIQEQTPDGYRTIASSRSRIRANMSAGIRDSNWGK